MTTETTEEILTRPKYPGPRLVTIVALQPPEPMRQADGKTLRTDGDGYKGPNRFYLNVVNLKHQQEQKEATQSAWKSVKTNHWDRHKDQDYVLTMNADGLVADISVKKRKGFGGDAASAGTTPGEPCVVIRQYPDNTASVTNTPEKVDGSRVEDMVGEVIKNATSNTPIQPGQLLLERYRVVRVSREVGHIDIAIDPMPTA